MLGVLRFHLLLRARERVGVPHAGLNVYDRMHNDVKMSGDRNMWEQRSWTAQGNMTIYRSNSSWAAS